MRTPRKRKPTGTPKPTGGIRGATQAQLNRIRQRQKPTGTPTPQSKPPTSAQRAAMRKQRKAVMGTPTQQQARQRIGLKRMGATEGQKRSLKMAQQKFRQGKFAPKRTTKRTSRRLV